MISTNEFTKWLEQFINFERDPKKDLLNLKKMQRYAEFFGNPQLTYKTIHVAGSKGKGSVSTMIAVCLKEAGFKTGLYTSPHVMDFRERVSCAGSFFSDEAYSRAYGEIMDGFNKIIHDDPSCDPTWFEIVTMLSFVIFKNEKLDYAVFEVGMGGRLDTTNIIQPEVCAIMPIELEHCQYLGDTIAKIAFEKAGIIKAGVPFFCFEQKPEAFEVFKKTSSERHAEMYYMPDLLDRVDYKVSLEGLTVDIAYKPETKVGAYFSRSLHTTLRLLDEVQAKNAALTAALMKYLFPTMSEHTLEVGLSKAWLFARFEILSQNPLVIGDGAHTVSSLQLCVSTYKKLRDQKGILVFACAEDKDMNDFPELFESCFDSIYLTIPGVFKKSNLVKLQSSFEKYFSGKANKVETSSDFTATIKKAYAEAQRLDKPLVITGSFYLVAEAKHIFASL